MNYNKHYKISKLLAKYISNTLSEEENKELKRWQQTHENNIDLFSKICKNNQEEYDQFVDSIEVKNKYLELQKRIKKNPKPIQTLSYLYKIAAVLIIGIIVSVLLINKEQQINSNIADSLIGDKIEVILHDGKKIELDENAKKSVTISKNYAINLTNQKIEYTIKDAKKLANQYNTIKIPKGGEYKLILSDGTIVWLNSVTKFKYPIHFNSKQRVVELQGEAYFEVAKDKSRKFIVKTPDKLNVEVLGTHFNVKAYKNDKTIETTLVEGSVRVSNNKHKVVLKPNEQLIFNKKNKSTQKQRVDTRMYTSWIKGLYIFEGATLEQIMVQLERWYDIKVFFMNDDLKKYKFTGDLIRNEGFITILNNIQLATNIKYEINNKTVVIRK